MQFSIKIGKLNYFHGSIQIVLSSSLTKIKLSILQKVKSTSLHSTRVNLFSKHGQSEIS